LELIDFGTRSLALFLFKEFLPYKLDLGTRNLTLLVLGDFILLDLTILLFGDMALGEITFTHFPFAPVFLFAGTQTRGDLQFFRRFALDTDLDFLQYPRLNGLRLPLIQTFGDLH
jgi:hypothetical protein